jgi:pimeloyl-ACP methyl ester carboxylesterase
MGNRFSSLVTAFCLLAALASAQTSISDGPAPGRLIDAGGRKMHLYCTGNGNPTVILESSFGQFGLDWWFVQPEVTKFARVCSYDRAGLGWSEAGRYREHPEQIVADLHALLSAAGEKPPYVFASMGMGAFYTRAYQLRYPSEAAGFVFIEPTHEDAFMIPLGSTPTPLWAVSPEQARAFAASLNDNPRPPPPPLLSTQSPFDRLPPELLKTRLAFEKRSLQTSSAEDQLVEFESRRAAAAALHTGGQALGTRPIVVLTAERGMSGLSRDVQAKVSALSQNSVQRVVPSGHFVHLQEPALVVKAIADVVSAVRNRSNVAP